MNLTGYSLAQVLGIFAAAGLATLLLYLLKLRRREVQVPFVDLWQQVLGEQRSSRLHRNLKRIFSLLIALTVVAALAFALGDPRNSAPAQDARTLVVFVDASASMQSSDVAPSRLAAAKDEALHLIEELHGDDRMLIAQLDSTATPLSPLTSEAAVLRDAVEALYPTDSEANFEAARHLGEQLLAGQPGAELVFISDGGLLPLDPQPDPEGAGEDSPESPGESPLRLSWIRVGSDAEHVGNVAITAFSVRRYPLDKSQSEVLVEVRNTNRESTAIELELLGDGESVDLRPLTLEPGERRRQFFRNISGVDERLEAVLRLPTPNTTTEDDTPTAAPESNGAPGLRPTAQNQLLVDDHAFAQLPPRRRARVAVVTEGNLYLQAALLLDEYLSVEEFTPEQWPPSENFDVVIFDRAVPDSPPGIPALFLHPEPAEGTEPAGAPFAVQGRFEAPYMDRLNRRHPLLRWTALRDVNIAESLDIELQRGDEAIARSNDGVPLIITGTRNAPFVAFAFDPRQSDLPLRVAWPLLLLNTIDHFLAESAGYIEEHRSGDVWRLPVAPDTVEATIIDPRGLEHSVGVRDGYVVYTGHKAGFYTLMDQHGRADFAVNSASNAEAALTVPERPQGTGAWGPASEGRFVLDRAYWRYLVLLALIILCAEAFSFHRRWTV